MATAREIARLVRAETALQGASVRADFALRRAARGTGPITVGPWTSEVGFEVLYWLPLLRWWAARYRIDPERVTAISRGGVSAWYRGIAKSYVELFDVVQSSELRAQQHRRAARQHLKQTERDDLDRDLLERFAPPQSTVLHPSLMYHLFAPFWARRRPATLFERRTLFAPLGGTVQKTGHAAVKVYWSQAFPDRPANREILDRCLRRLAATMPVVILSTADEYDDHNDWVPSDSQDVVVVRPSDPATNLAEQASVIAGASLFVTVHGGFAHLGPFLGTSTVALHDGSEFIQAHSHAADISVRALRAQGSRAGCVTIDVADLESASNVLDWQ